MSAYYNEIDPFCAQWLRNLITKNLIAPGEVDERDIRDVKPDDLRGFKQCHFFAGIGGWSYALRLAGWSDDREVWTGSCPCQPFSDAGGRRGTADERHLWPVWYELIRERAPSILFGEQVASKAALAWCDTVQDDLEGQGYAFGASDLCAAGVGAPHIRQRLYFVALSGSERREGIGLHLQPGPTRFDQPEVGRSGEAGFMGDSREQGSGRHSGALPRAQGSPTGRLRGESDESQSTSEARFIGRVGPLDESWSTPDWLLCRDGKWRPVEPGTQQMVDGLSRGMGRLCSGDNKEKVKHAEESSGFGNEILRAMRGGYGSQEIWHRVGGQIGFSSATLLLSYMCEQSRELGEFFYSATPKSPSVDQGQMREMSAEACAVTCSSYRWGLSEQCIEQLSDALPELSQIGASLGQFTGLPLAHKIPSRVGRLRAYGNAIVPQVAAAFISAAMEAFP